jgi:hypothetical protein
MMVPALTAKEITLELTTRVLYDEPKAMVVSRFEYPGWINPQRESDSLRYDTVLLSAEFRLMMPEACLPNR